MGLQRLAFRRKAGTLGIAALALIAAHAALPWLRFELNFYESRVQGLASLDELRESRERYGDGASLLLGVRPAGGGFFSEKELCGLRAWMHDQANHNLRLAGLTDPFWVRRPVTDVATKKTSWTPLVPLGCEKPGDERLPLDSLVHSPWAGLATSAKGDDITLELTFSPLEKAGPFGGFDPAPVGEAIASLKEKVAGPLGLKVVAGGQAALLMHLLGALARDNVLNLLAVVVLVLALRTFLGTWAAGLWFTGLTLATTMVTVGLMAALGSPIDVLNNTLFIILCIAGLEDFLFVSSVQLATGATGPRLFRRLLVPSFLTSLTTCIGFGSLLVSDLGIIRRFGGYAAFGSLVEFLVFFLVWPLLLGSSRRWTDPARVFGARWLRAGAAFRPRRWIAVALLVGVALTLPSLRKLRVEEFPDQVFPPDHPQTEFYHYFRETRGWEGSFFVDFADPAALTPELEAAVARHPNVAKALSARAVEAWFTEKVAPGERAYMARLARDSLSGGSFLANGNAGARVFLYLKGTSVGELGATLAHVRAACGEKCAPKGELVVFHDFVERISKTLFDSLAAGLFLVGALLWVLTRARSREAPWKVIASSFWSPLAVLGLLAWLEVPVNLGCSVFASVVVGLTGDNAIQYLFAARPGRLEEGLENRGGATIQLSALMVAISLLFLGMTLLSMRKLGALLAAGFVLALVGDLWILHGLLSRKRR